MAAKTEAPSFTSDIVRSSFNFSRLPNRTDRVLEFPPSLECKEFAASQSGGCIQKNHYTKAVMELGKLTLTTSHSQSSLVRTVLPIARRRSESSAL